MRKIDYIIFVIPVVKKKSHILHTMESYSRSEHSEVILKSEHLPGLTSQSSSIGPPVPPKPPSHTKNMPIHKNEDISLPSLMKAGRKDSSSSDETATRVIKTYTSSATIMS
jgi:hypothetical protein